MTAESTLEKAEVPSQPGVAGASSAAPYGIFAAIAALLLPTAFSTEVFSGFVTPKYLVLLLVAAVGFVPAVRLARSSRIAWTARAAIVFLVVGLVSALLSPAVNIGFFGLDGESSGWLFWLGCVGAFALGARLRRNELDWLFAGFIGGAVINALVAIFQVTQSPSNLLALYQGSQADGLLGNPIYLEALLLGALALIAHRAVLSERRMAWWPVVALLSVTLEFTLERVALPIMLVIIVVSLAAYGLRRAVPFGVLTLAGYGLGYVTGGSGLSARVASGTAQTTFGTRLRIWNLALKSVVHHPFFGIGPGQVASVIAPHLTRSFALTLGNGNGVLPFDSHDFLVEVLATTGILGFVAFVAWVAGAGLKARGPFLACALAMLAIELVEPLNLAITPMALLALGAATVTHAGEQTGLAALRQWKSSLRAKVTVAVAPEPDADPPGAEDVRPVAVKLRPFQPAPVLTALLTALSLLVGITMVIGDHYLLVSYDAQQPAPKIAAALQANTYIPYWPDPPAAVAEGYLLRADLTTPSAVNQALSWQSLAARRDPRDPTLRSAMGSLELQLGNLSGARAQFLDSLQLDPWILSSLEGLGTVAKDEKQWRESIYWYRRALLVTSSPEGPTHLIQIDETHLTP